MAPKTACPVPADLQALLLGRLPPERAQPLERHLLTCSACQARAVELAPPRVRVRPLPWLWIGVAGGVLALLLVALLVVVALRPGADPLLLGGAAALPDRGERTHLIVVRRLEVQPTNAQGAVWDSADSLPDLTVTVTRHDPDLVRQQEPLAAEFEKLRERDAWQKHAFGIEQSMARLRPDDPAWKTNQASVERLRREYPALTAAEQQRLRDLERQVNELRGRYQRTTPQAGNTTHASFNIPCVFVKEGEKVKIVVLDQDPFRAEMIGQREVTITQEMLDRGGIVLTDFDQVLRLQLDLTAAP